MGLKHKIEERIARKEKEIQELQRAISDLETRVREAKAYIQGLQDTLKLVPGEPGETKISAIRSGSLTELALRALTKNGAPMHINDLLYSIGKEPTRQNRSSLSGSLGAYVRQHEIFSRPSPNTFGLLEWSQDRKAIEEVPEDFGLNLDTSEEHP